MTHLLPQLRTNWSQGYLWAECVLFSQAMQVWFIDEILSKVNFKTSCLIFIGYLESQPFSFIFVENKTIAYMLIWTKDIKTVVMYNLCVLNIYKHDSILYELLFTIKELVLFKPLSFQTELFSSSVQRGPPCLWFCCCGWPFPRPPSAWRWRLEWRTQSWTWIAQPSPWRWHRLQWGR